MMFQFKLLFYCSCCFEIFFFFYFFMEYNFIGWVVFGSGEGFENDFVVYIFCVLLKFFMMNVLIMWVYGGLGFLGKIFCVFYDVQYLGNLIIQCLYLYILILNWGLGVWVLQCKINGGRYCKFFFVVYVCVCFLWVFNSFLQCSKFYFYFYEEWIIFFWMSVLFDMVGLLYVGNWCVGKNGRGRIFYWFFVCVYDVCEE